MREGTLRFCLCFLRIYALTTLVSNSRSQIDLVSTSRSLVIDQYGHQTTLIYDGGRVFVDCYLREGLTCEPGDRFQLLDNGTGAILALAQCQNLRLGTHGRFKISVNEQTPFGEYRCYFNDQQLGENSINFAYRLCSDKSHACTRSVDCDEDTDMKFCFASRDGVYPCSKIPYLQWCPKADSASKLCPVDSNELCRAIYHDYSRTWFEWSGSRHCPTVHEPPLHYGGFGRLYGEPFVIDPNEPDLEFRCRNGTPFFNERIDLRVRAAESSLVFKRSQNCQHRVEFTLGRELFTSGVRVYFLELSDHYGYFRCRNKLISFGANLSVLMTSNITNELACALSAPIGQEFQVMQWWTRPDGDGVVLEDGWNVTATRAGGYQCHVSFVYKTCSPHRKFTYNISSEIFFVSAGPRKRGCDGYWLWMLIATFHWRRRAVTKAYG